MTVPVVRSQVGGRPVDGGEIRDRCAPADGEVVARVALAGTDVADAACEASAVAAGSWRRRPGGERGAVLDRAGLLLADRARSIGRDLAREEGKTLGEAVAEVGRAAQILRYFGAQAAFEPDGSTYPAADERTLLYARRVPIGVVAAITPWNFPIAIPAWKLAPALAYGNAVVWKPAEVVPLTSQALHEAFVDAGLPPGVLSVLVARGDVVGRTLCEHDAVDALSFTGSDVVGHEILAAAAPLRKRVQLELGGKNPAVVLRDADLDVAARAVARGAFLSAGQKCTATSRVIVDGAVADAFTARLTRLADAMPVGDPLDDGVEIGPLVSPGAAARVRDCVARAEQHGDRITRRAPEGDDAFVPPVVLAGLPASSEILQEEIFGPVAGVIVAADADHALELANATRYGLSASVFTASSAAALRFARELDVGAVKINQESPGNEPHLPFGGTKSSSYGQGEQGKAAAEFFTRWKSVYFEGEA